MFKDDKTGKAGQVHGANASLPTIGIVTDNVHPQDDFRVKVKFPMLPGDDTSFWCRIGTFGAGPGGQGAFFLPEVNDEVLVVFVNGDFNQGVIISSLWNGQDKPAFSNNSGSSQTSRYNSDTDATGSANPAPEAKKNDIRSISSRKKHEIVFNDNDSNPRVIIQSGQKHRIVLDDAGGEASKIVIADGKSENYITIDTKNKSIMLESKTGDIHLKAKGSVIIEAEKNIETTSQQDTKMTAQQNITANASSNVTIKASGSGDIESSATMTIKGATVNIN